MADKRRDPAPQPPVSPTEIALNTGMCAPGLADLAGELEDVRGPLEEALVMPTRVDEEPSQRLT